MWIYSVLGVILATVSGVAGSCPSDAVLPEVFVCLVNITHGHNGHNVLAGTSTGILQQYCHDGLFNASVQCLDRLYRRCEGEDGIYILQDEIARPEIWRMAVHQLCSNLEGHAVQNLCITRHRPLILECLKHNDAMFSQNIGQHNSWPWIKHNICRFYLGMNICTAKIVKEKCGQYAGSLLGDFLSSITPLMCNHNNNNAGQPQYHVQQPRLSSASHNSPVFVLPFYGILIHSLILRSVYHNHYMIAI